MIDLMDFVEAIYDPVTPKRSTGYMYGLNNVFEDGPCARDYDPWEHADALDLPIVYRNDLPSDDMVACASVKHGAIFVRPNLHTAVERCAVAHEIVHVEYHDVGFTKAQEDRADRVAARRLIRPRRLSELETNDPGLAALELGVTERIMRMWMRLAREGIVRGY